MNTQDRSEKPRIYADFNKWTGQDGEHWLILECIGTFKDLERLGLKLEVGLEAIFYMDDADDDGNLDDLEADGVVKYDSVYGRWIAVIDYDKIRHASDRLRELREKEKRGGSHDG